MTPEGREYMGTMYYHPIGTMCNAWTIGGPHDKDKAMKQIVSFDENFPDDTVVEAWKYCRNPGIPANRTRPWCFSSDTALQWAYCDDIPMCSGRPVFCLFAGSTLL